MNNYVFLVWHIALKITLQNANRTGAGTGVIKNATLENFEKAREKEGLLNMKVSQLCGYFYLSLNFCQIF